MRWRTNNRSFAFLLWCAATTAAPGSVLDIRINQLHIQKADMGQALEQLRAKNPRQILIGFETISAPDAEPVTFSNLNFRNETVGHILVHLCRLDPRYHFQMLGDPRIVNVFPVGARSAETNLLNLQISHFDIHARELPQTLIRSIHEYAPELREHLRERTKPPLAFPGSILTGDAAKPEIELHLENLTVRELLNQIVLYTSDHASQLGFAFPLSWKYEFVVDPASPTGLGGNPKWDLL